MTETIEYVTQGQNTLEAGWQVYRCASGAQPGAIRPVREVERFRPREEVA